MKVTFTSFRDSMSLEGLKLSIDRHPPRPCYYPVLQYLTPPIVRGMSDDSIERIYNLVLDSNGGLLLELVQQNYELGIRSIILCCWCTGDKISGGKACVAPLIGGYLDRHRAEFGFGLVLDYRDGRGYND